MNRLVFRTDASTQIGAGHVARCATLARVLSQRGADVHFLCRPLKGNLCNWLEAKGFCVTRMLAKRGGLSDDIAETRLALAELAPVDGLIVDHYGLDARWESEIRPWVNKVIVIDDKANRAHDCDILLDQNYMGGALDRYDHLVSAASLKLFGPRYALLGDDFRAAGNKPRVRDGSVRRLLICFGGTDPVGHSLAALRALSLISGTFEHVDVATNPENPSSVILRERCSEFQNVRFHCPAENLIELMQLADLALGAGGIMNWERACLGLPTIAMGIVDNQTQTLASLIHDGIVLGQASMLKPNAKLMASWLQIAANSPSLMRGLSERSKALVDGRGVERVADILIPPVYILRPATFQDSENIFSWRNSSEVSAASVSGSLPNYSSHKEWFCEILADDNRILLIIESEQCPVGVVRFDCNNFEALISIYRIPNSTVSRGLIREATEWLRRNRKDIKRVVANVLPDNDRSRVAFLDAGYKYLPYRLFKDMGEK